MFIKCDDGSVRVGACSVRFTDWHDICSGYVNIDAIVTDDLGLSYRTTWYAVPVDLLAYLGVETTYKQQEKEKS